MHLSRSTTINDIETCYLTPLDQKKQSRRHSGCIIFKRDGDWRCRSDLRQALHRECYPSFMKIVPSRSLPSWPSVLYILHFEWFRSGGVYCVGKPFHRDHFNVISTEGISCTTEVRKPLIHMAIPYPVQPVCFHPNFRILLGKVECVPDYQPAPPGSTFCNFSQGILYYPGGKTPVKDQNGNVFQCKFVGKLSSVHHLVPILQEFHWSRRSRWLRTMQRWN